MIFKITNFLKHYASKYYDPVKAHEYYMRTRELKGKRSSVALNDEGKRKWSYVKAQIMEERKQQLIQIRVDKTNKIKSFREQAKAQQANITKSITKKLKKTISNISESVEEQLYTIPKNATEGHKERLKRLNAQIRERAKNKKQRKQSQAQETIQNNNAQQQKQKKELIKNEMNSSIENARSSFIQKKDVIVNKYLKILDDEYNKILSEYGKKGAKQVNNAPISSMTDADQRRYRNERYKQRNNIK